MVGEVWLLVQKFPWKWIQGLSPFRPLKEKHLTDSPRKEYKAPRHSVSCIAIRKNGMSEFITQQNALWKSWKMLSSFRCDYTDSHINIKPTSNYLRQCKIYGKHIYLVYDSPVKHINGIYRCSIIVKTIIFTVNKETYWWHVAMTLQLN